MSSKGYKKERRSSKSIDKRNSIKKTIAISGKCRNVQNRSPDSVPHSPTYQAVDRVKTRSCLAGYKPSTKQKVGVSMEKLMPMKKISMSGWMEEQLMTTLIEKRSRKWYEYLHPIGKGGFGKVYKVKEKRTGQLFAIKEMSKAVILSKKSSESIRNEREHLRLLKHNFIVNMRQAFQDRDSLYLVLDLMPGGDLRHHISRKHRFTEEQTRFFAASIFLGLEYMHANKVIHRDIKPENLVLDFKGYLRITDLGIAKLYRENNHSDTSGTPGYMAPEVMTSQNHSYEVDYYALGVIIHELMLGRRPYVGCDRKAIREQILAKQAAVMKNQIPQGWSMEAADFVNKLIQRRPVIRLGWGSSSQLKQHSWLKDFPWDKLLNGALQSPFKSYSKYNFQQVRYLPTKQDEQFSNRLKQNKLLLRKSSTQSIFQGYTFEQQYKPDDHNTTSSEFNRRRELSIRQM